MNITRKHILTYIILACIALLCCLILYIQRRDPLITIRRVSDGKIIRCIWGRRSDRDTSALCFSPDGKYLASVSGDYAYNLLNTVWLWRISDGKLMNTYRIPDVNLISPMDFSPDGKLIAVGGQQDSGGDSKAYILNTKDGHILQSFVFRRSYRITYPDLIRFADNGNQLIVGDGQNNPDYRIYVYRVSDGKLVKKLPPSTKFPNPKLSPDGKYLATPSGLKRVADGKVLYELKSFHAGDISAITFSRDGKLLAYGRENYKPGYVERCWEDLKDRLSSLK